jgi:hypothetical protein
VTGRKGERFVRLPAKADIPLLMAIMVLARP